MLTPQQQRRLTAFAAAAVRAERMLGYPAEAIVAQWAVESGWGAAETGANNVFGMTYVASRHKAYRDVPTREFVTWDELQRFQPAERASARTPENIVPTKYEGKRWLTMTRRFAAFDSLEDAIADKVRLITLNPRYATAWKAYQTSKRPANLLRGIAAAGYATDPNYAGITTSIASAPAVIAAIADARKDN